MIGYLLVGGAVVLGFCAALFLRNKLRKNDFGGDFERNKREVIQQLKKQNEERIIRENEELKKQIWPLEFQKQNLESSLNQLEVEIQNAKEEKEQNLQDLRESCRKELENVSKQQSMDLQSIQLYHNQEKERIEADFEDYKIEVEKRKRELSDDLAAARKKQEEIIEFYKQEEIKKNQLDFYKIKISENEKGDIKKLKELAYNFSKPEALHKLIYEVYYKTKLEELFKRLLGENKNKGGIYKISNVNNNKVYIGKTTKFLDRFRTHCKRGCGIERISGALYDAMFEEGLENFTFEVLSVCEKEEQTEKEKYFIEFFKSSEYGYNLRKG